MIFPDLNFEVSLIPQDCRYLLAIDEVGRGPWAGPVTMAGCLLDLSTGILDSLSRKNIRDSKLLSSLQRQKIAEDISSLPHTIKSKDNCYIDQYGLATSLKTLIDEIIDSFSRIDYILIDGNYSLKISHPYRSIVAGDRRCFSIAAASILAKVYRDQYMDKVSRLYPHYGFDQHKGYGTKQHQLALQQYGPCPLHRRSFRPIQKYFVNALLSGQTQSG